MANTATAGLAVRSASSRIAEAANVATRPPSVSALGVHQSARVGTNWLVAKPVRKKQGASLHGAPLCEVAINVSGVQSAAVALSPT